MSEEKTTDKGNNPSPDAPEKESVTSEEKNKRDPIKLWTNIVVGLCIAIFIGHILADKYTPYTSNGRVEAFVVPIVPQVSGPLTRVNVTNNQFVSADQVLAVIDSATYELAVRRPSTGNPDL